MRIAILADIHGNQAAFEAALEDAARQRAERILIAGDVVVGAPDSAACWRLARSLGCPILRGNHEGYVAMLDHPDAPAVLRTPQFAPVQWAAAQLTPEERRAADTLPTHLRPTDLPGLLLVHASLRNDHDSIHPYTPDEELAAMFPGVTEPLIIRAHNHAGQVRLWRGQTIVTTSSVGLALNGHPTAQYLLLEQTRDGWIFHHRAAAYDVAATLRRFQTSGYLETAGPLARLYQREVATGSHQIVPFLRTYSAWSREQPLGLEEALERFLTTV